MSSKPIVTTRIRIIVLVGLISSWQIHPFNVDRVDMERLKDDPRFPFGMPRVDNANYLWIQLFYSALSESGRAGFVMANSAADARASELEIRTQIIKSGAVDVIVSIASNFFYTVTLPCTLWFFDKSKRDNNRHDKVLFIDARHPLSASEPRAPRIHHLCSLNFLRISLGFIVAKFLKISTTARIFLPQSFLMQRILMFLDFARWLRLPKLKRKDGV